MWLSPLGIFRCTDRDSASRYQLLQRPFDPDFARAQLVTSPHEDLTILMLPSNLRKSIG